MEIVESWLGMEGLTSGNPYLLRIRENMQPFIDSKKYSHRFDIIWKYLNTGEARMPDEQQMEVLEAAEASLVAALHHDLQAVLSMVYLGNNQKVLYLYSSNVEETAKRINTTIKTVDGLTIEINAMEDTDWKQYKKVMESVG